MTCLVYVCSGTDALCPTAMPLTPARCVLGLGTHRLTYVLLHYMYDVARLAALPAMLPARPLGACLTTRISRRPPSPQVLLPPSAGASLMSQDAFKNGEPPGWLP